MKILVAAFCALLVTPHLPADHHHRDWMNYYPGEWEYEFKSKEAPSEKGTVNWTLEANGKALVGRFTTENGDQEVEVAGCIVVGVTERFEFAVEALIDTYHQSKGRLITGRGRDREQEQNDRQAQAAHIINLT